MSYGIKVSKSGYDISTAGDENLTVNSDYPLLKIVKKGTGSLVFTTSDKEKTATIAHNLGYAPLAKVSSEFYYISVLHGDWTDATVLDGYFLPMCFGMHYEPYTTGLYTYETDNTNLTITVSFDDNVGNNGTIDYFYFIYYDAY
jgi:hypothetical protein